MVQILRTPRDVLCPGCHQSFCKNQKISHVNFCWRVSFFFPNETQKEARCATNLRSYLLNIFYQLYTCFRQLSTNIRNFISWVLVVAVPRLSVRGRWHKGGDGEGSTHRRKSPKRSGMVVLDKNLLGIKLRSYMPFWIFVSRLWTSPPDQCLPESLLLYKPSLTGPCHCLFSQIIISVDN